MVKSMPPGTTGKLFQLLFFSSLLVLCLYANEQGGSLLYRAVPVFILGVLFFYMTGLIRRSGVAPCLVPTLSMTAALSLIFCFAGILAVAGGPWGVSYPSGVPIPPSLDPWRQTVGFTLLIAAALFGFMIFLVLYKSWAILGLLILQSLALLSFGMGSANPLTHPVKVTLFGALLFQAVMSVYGVVREEPMSR